jgi:hypothetical protein
MVTVTKKDGEVIADVVTAVDTADGYVRIERSGGGWVSLKNPI